MAQTNQFTGILTDKQKKACQLYIDETSDTYQNKVRSYIKAGYKDTPSAFSSSVVFFGNPKILQYLEQLRVEKQEQESKKSIRDILNADYTLEKAKAHLERCIANGDNTNTTAMLKLLAQVNGLLIDRKEIDQTNRTAGIPQEELEELQELARLNNIRLSNKTG